MPCLIKMGNYQIWISKTSTPKADEIELDNIACPAGTDLCSILCYIRLHVTVIINYFY